MFKTPKILNFRQRNLRQFCQFQNKIIIKFQPKNEYMSLSAKRVNVEQVNRCQGHCKLKTGKNDTETETKNTIRKIKISLDVAKYTLDRIQCVPSQVKRRLLFRCQNMSPEFSFIRKLDQTDFGEFVRDSESADCIDICLLLLPHVIRIWWFHRQFDYLAKKLACWHRPRNAIHNSILSFVHLLDFWMENGVVVLATATPNDLTSLKESLSVLSNAIHFTNWVYGPNFALLHYCLRSPTATL